MQTVTENQLQNYYNGVPDSFDRPSYDFPVELQPVFLSNGDEIKNRKAVVRTDTMNTLGIVSNDYGLVLHKTVIDSFREAGKDYNVSEKISLRGDGAYLFYQMTFPSVEMEIKKGDIVRMMMIAKNSYNAMNSLQVIFGAFRLVCANGMIIGTRFLSFNFRHVGNVGGLNSMFMVEEYKQAYKNYVSMFGERMPQIQEMARSEIDFNYLDAEGLFQPEQVKLPQYLLDEAKLSFRTGNDNTVWGYYNSLTYAITHKMKTSNPQLAINYGVEAWKAAELITH
jgi:hypothetical protein